MATVPLVEPTTARAGDTWAWRREDLTGTYPASTWTLTYVVKNVTNAYSFAAAADGANFAITVDAATTKTFAGGNYRLFGQVANGAEKHTVYDGPLGIIADVFDTPTTPQDTRSWAQTSLDNINAVIQNRASTDQKRYEIAGRSLERMSVDELLKLREYFLAEASSEQATGAAGRTRNSYVRFGVNV